MKKGKLFSICLALGTLIASFCFIFLPLGGDSQNSNQTKAYASYTRSETYSNTTGDNTKNPTRIGNTNIPYSLYTSYTPSGSVPQITDYYPDAKENGNSYTMGEESAPYIVLSSKTSTSADSILNRLYNTTIFLKFNTQDLINIEPKLVYATIPDLYLTNTIVTLKNTHGDFTLYNESYVDRSNTSNLGFNFQLNLKPTTTGNSGAPKTDVNTYLGDDDTSYRTGLYTISIEYNYLLNTSTYTRASFSISFYVIDYSDYISMDDASPLTFENASKYTPTLKDGATLLKEYYIYNYNFDNAPIVNYDASKFALNFKYYVGSNDDSYYEFLYKNFTPLSSGEYSGYVTLECAKLGKTYNIYTKDTTAMGAGPQSLYCASFDLKDFEDNFILQNNSALQTSVFQGKFVFSLDLLTSGGNNGTFVKIDKNLFEDDVQNNLSFQNLIIYGYDLKYIDDNPNSSTYNKSVSLINDVTHTSVYSSNDYATTPYVSVPDKIATTNNVPLTFFCYGDLSSSGTSYNAQYALIKNATDDIRSQVITSVKELETTPTTNLFEKDIFKNNKSTYSQSSDFNSVGIYFIDLQYTIKINVPTQKEVSGELEEEMLQVSISGTQYVLFEIDNSSQELYVHSIEQSGSELLAYDFYSFTNKNVRIAVEEKDNMFLANSSYVYTYSSNYNTTTSSGTLAFKKDGNKNATYTLNGKTYNYLVINQNNNFTFSNDGSYKVSIRRDNNNYISYSFKIDRTKFSDVSVNKAVTTNDGSYVKGERLEATSLDNGGGYIDKNIYVTDSAFTLGWKEKDSGATSSVYVVYMELKEDTSSTTQLKLLKQTNNEYWLTNKYYFSDIITNAESNYKNSYSLTELSTNNYFEKQGLWYFFLYDQAGNYTTLAVLIDQSLPSIAQGEWAGNFENSAWTSTFNTDTNPNNYVNTNTYLYFGTHKAIAFNQDIIDEACPISIQYNKNYSNCYVVNSNTNETKAIAPATFDFRTDVLYKLNDIKRNQGSSLFDSSSSTTDYYLLRANSSYNYTYLPYENNTKNATTGTRTISSSNYYVGIFAQDEPGLNREFTGEANYTFTLSNSSNLSVSRKITMNFENIQTSFYAYNQADNPIYIEKGSGTNLKTLRFVYKLLNEGATATYYNIESLTYTYYPFDLTTSNNASYPFASTSTLSDVDMLKNAKKLESGEYVVDGININQAGETLPGKYVITRTYVGGNYNWDSASGQYVATSDGKGGRYYKDGDKYIDLFTTDKLTRSYEVYIDNNSIINTSKNVGNNIYLSLSNGDKTWKFTDFNKMSSGNEQLVTNLSPVKINIPYSKYIYYTNNNFIASNYSFSKLNLEVVYETNSGIKTTYIADGYDGALGNNTGLLTCTDLVTSTNTKGYFIFSKEGKYTLKISDNTGYNLTNNNTIQYNLNPTQMEFTFSISYSSLSAEAYSYVGNNSTFETTKLTSETPNYFSTNAQALAPINKDGNNLNKIFLTFSDPKTPYISKISAIKIYSKNRERSLEINTLGEEKLLALADTGNVIAIIINGIDDYSIATLDKATLVTTNYLCYLEVGYFDKNNTSETYDGENYYRFTYNLYFTLQEEDEFSINLSTNTSSTLANQATFTLSVDRTKPYSNLDRLVTNETFLQVRYKDNLSKFKDEDIFDGSESDINATFYNSPNNLTYSFGVSKNFSLNYDSQETVSYFYVRSYNKYNGGYPSITPDMADTIYMTHQEFANYPRFNELSFNNSTITIGANSWYKINYSTASLYNQILSVTKQTPQGHYEIIERDVAGNYRTFTVYFDTGNPLIIINGIDNDTRTYEDNVEQNLTANKTFQITQLASNLGWGVIKITNETLGIKYSKEIVLKPDVDVLIVNQLKTSLNEFLNAKVNSRYSFELVKYNDTFGTSRRSVSIITNKSLAYLEAPEIIEETKISTNTTTYRLKFPAYSDKDVLYLTQLTLKKYIKSENTWQTILNFTNKEDIVKNNPYQVEKGIYKVLYKDNYNTNTYEYNVYVGEYVIEDFDKRYNFETSYIYDEATDTYYTGGSVTVTFEANIYSNIIVNNQTWTTNIKDSTTIVNKNCKTFTLSSSIDSSNASAGEVIGGTTSYTINYKDVTGAIQQNKSIKIVIYDKLPEILLTNKNGTAISSTTFESTSQITNSVVNVDWGKIEDCDYSLINDGEDSEATIVSLYKRNNDGSYSLKGTLKRGDIIKDEGFYKLELKNSHLGNARYAYFAIQFGEFPLYSVSDGKKELSPSSLEKLDITTTYNGATTILETIKNALLDKKDDTSLSLVKQNNKKVYELLLESFGYRKLSTGDYSFSESNIGIANVKKLNHYYSTTDMQIIYNSNMDLNIVEFLFENDELKRCYVKGGEKATVTYDYNKYYTTIYLVYSWGASPKIQLFATTRVPVSTSLLDTNLKYGERGTINLSSYPTSMELTNSQEIKNNILILGFNNLKYGVTSKWYNQGNYIYCLEQYGVEKEYSIVDFYSTSNTYNYISLTASGTHRLKFMDFAGNVHKFTNNTYDYYTLYIITKVVYSINYNGNTINPVENAIYNDKVSLQLDEYYTKKDKFKYSISVVRNGQRYTNYTQENSLFTFKEAGRYVVTFTATYNNIALENSVYNFTILSKTSARLAYEFSETLGYEIVKVVRNNVDITSNFEKDGKVTSLFISSSDSRSGNGYYTVTLKYGDKESDKLIYSFLINDYVPSISSSVEYGETTTSDINISYNPSYIYNQLGRCYIVVYVYNSDSQSFYEYARFTIDENQTSSLNSFALTRSNSYFVQVKTETGNTISSFRVDKKDPLNTFAIIIIVLSIITVVVLTIVIIKLRTRMRVK